MNSEDLPLPGGRDVRATLDAPETGDPNAGLAASPSARGPPARSHGPRDSPSPSLLDRSEARGASCVVACPPHPQHRGHRGDGRLKAVSEYLCDRGVACLRFDYGEWDEGYGEREDARNALRWARDRYDRVGLFGFSFGGAIAALAAATTGVDLGAVALLAPTAELSGGLDAAAAVADIDADVPLLVAYATRDTTADWEPVVEAARDAGATVTELDADHFFVGKFDQVAATVGPFLADELRA